MTTSRQQIEALVNAYRQAERVILKHLAYTAETAVATRAWYEQQAETLRQLQRHARDIMAEATPSMEAIQSIIDQGYAEGFAEATPEGAAPVSAAVPVHALAATAQETVGGLTAAGVSILRTTDDAFREVGRAAVEGQLAAGANRVQAVQATLDAFARRGLTSFVDEAGRRWGMDTYAEMVLRTGVNRAQNEGRLRGYQAHGVTLLHCSQHLGADDHCQPFQNKILSTDGRSGPRRVVDPATGEEVTVNVYATLQSAVQRGLLHVNCRHTLTAYIPGTPLPATIHATDEHYMAEQEQRYNERMIRQWRRMEVVALTPERRRYAASKVREWQARQRAHVAKHQWLTRRYDREQVRHAGKNHPVPFPRKQLIAGKDMKRGQLKPVRKALKGVKNPRWDETNAPKAFRLYGDSVSDLRVDTKHLIEHVTYGVRDNPPRRRTGGHLYGVVPSRGWKTWFREEDGPERILKMLDETLNDPEFMVVPGERGNRRGVAKWIDGNLYKAEWFPKGGGQRFLSFHPVCGRDILEANSAGQVHKKAGPNDEDLKGWKEVKDGSTN